MIGIAFGSVTKLGKLTTAKSGKSYLPFTITEPSGEAIKCVAYESLGETLAERLASKARIIVFGVWRNGSLSVRMCHQFDGGDQ